MNIRRKALAILAVLFFIAIATLFISRTMTEENEQHLFECTARADDTCGKIVVGFSVSVISIVEANNLKRDCSNIYVGQVLLIPYPTPTSFGSPVATSRDAVIDCFEREEYTAKDGGTLETISNKYKVSKEAIAFLNGLLENKVEAGMQLVIPLCYKTPSP